MKKVFLIISLLLLITACSVDQPGVSEPSVVEEDNNEQEVIEVVVKSNPIITINSDSLKTVWNKPIDLLEGVSAKDYLGNDLKVKVVGKYDFNGMDTYNLEYLATDLNGLSTSISFQLIVGEPEVLCYPDAEKGSAPDNQYLPCDYVFEEELKNFKNNSVAEFDPKKDGWKQCELEGQKYDKTLYVTDCIPLLDNVRNTAKVGLWVGERDKNVDRQLFQTFQTHLLNTYGIKLIDVMAAEMIGAIEGYKYNISDEIKVEVYLFKEDSEAYKKIKETGKVALEGFGDFDIIMNGFYGLIPDNTSQEIIDYFKSIE